MTASNQNYYEVLGVKRDAKLVDIGRAYNRLKSEMQQETAAPDKRRALLVQRAYDTLKEPESRDAYDQSLITPERKRRTALMSSVILGVAVIVAAGYFVFLPPPDKGRPPPAAAEILQAASLAVGSLRRIDMSGRTTPVGIAFALGEGLMVTTCQEISPGTQLVVHLSPRDIPARVSTTDSAAGLCQLAVDGVGSKPLAASGSSPRVGDKIYATKINAVGEVALIEGTVKKVSEEPTGHVVEASMPVAKTGSGGPLLDSFGRVVGVASKTQPDDRGRYVALPATWTAHQKLPRETILSAPAETPHQRPHPHRSRRRPPRVPSFRRPSTTFRPTSGRSSRRHTGRPGFPATSNDVLPLPWERAGERVT